VQATIRYVVLLLGNIVDSHKTFLDGLKTQIKLTEVSSREESDVIFAFVPIVSRAGTDLSAAMEKIPEDKPVVLVVFHHTFERDYLPPDSKLCVKRDRVFVVDCLFYEDQGFLKCQRNDNAVRAVKKHLIGKEHTEHGEQKPLVQRSTRQEERPLQLGGREHYLRKFVVVCLVCFVLVIIASIAVGIPVGGVNGTAAGVGAGFGVGAIVTIPVTVFLVKRFFVMVLGNTMDSHKTFLDHLKIPTGLCEVSSVKDCDVIIAFVPIVSRAYTDILAAMEKIPECKPVVLVLLHHTLYQYYVAPDSRLCVQRDRVFPVDCLFHEDQGLLRCQRNDDAIRAVTEHLIRQKYPEVKSMLVQQKMTDQEDEHKPLIQSTNNQEAQRQLLVQRSTTHQEEENQQLVQQNTTHHEGQRLLL
ncbi:uncharacterized protein DAT39_010057, partial [Clarias magur]